MLAVWGLCHADRVLGDAAPVCCLEDPGRFYLDLQPAKPARTYWSQPECCSLVLAVGCRFEDVATALENPFESPRRSDDLREVVRVGRVLQDYTGVGTGIVRGPAVAQDDQFARPCELRNLARHQAAKSDFFAGLQLQVRIDRFRGRELREALEFLGATPLLFFVVLCSACSRAQARRRHSSEPAASRISRRRFSRFLVETVEIVRPAAITGTSSRWKV